MLSQKPTFPRLPHQVWPHDHILINEMLTDMGQEMRTRHFQEGSKRSWQCWAGPPFYYFYPPSFLPCMCNEQEQRARWPRGSWGPDHKRSQTPRQRVWHLLPSYINDTCHPIWKHRTTWIFFLWWGRWQSEILFAFWLPKQMESDAFCFKYPFSGLFVFHLRRLQQDEETRFLGGKRHHNS